MREKPKYFDLNSNTHGGLISDLIRTCLSCVCVCVCIRVRLCVSGSFWIRWLSMDPMFFSKINKLFLQILFFPSPMQAYRRFGVISLRLFELIISFWISGFGSTEWIPSNELSAIIIINNTKMYLECVCLSVPTNRPIQPIWMRYRKPVLELWAPIVLIWMEQWNFLLYSFNVTLGDIYWAPFSSLFYGIRCVFTFENHSNLIKWNRGKMCKFSAISQFHSGQLCWTEMCWEFNKKKKLYTSICKQWENRIYFKSVIKIYIQCTTENHKKNEHQSNWFKNWWKCASHQPMNDGFVVMWNWVISCFSE